MSERQSIATSVLPDHLLPTARQDAARRWAFGVGFTPLALEEALGRVAGRAPDAPFAFIVTPNAQHIVLMHRSPKSLWRICHESAWLCVCDSQVVRRLAALSGLDLPLCTGSDLTAAIFARGLAPGDAVTVIGCEEAVVARLRRLFGHVRFQHHNPPMGYAADEEEVAKCVRFVEQHPARYVFLAVGAPRAEVLAARIAARGVAVGTGLCIGGALHFLAGVRPRAPEWMRRLGLEWLHRLLKEPRRLWRRVFVDSLPLLGLAAAEIGRQVLAGGRGEAPPAWAATAGAAPVSSLSPDGTMAESIPAPQQPQQGLALPVCAAIVSCNRSSDLHRCLASLAAQTPPVARVIVVDNGSTDGTPAMVRAEFPWVQLIEAGANLGACVARNLAAQSSEEPVLWFLDSDTEIAAPDGAAQLHALLAADPGLAAVGGEALLDEAGRSIGVKRLRCGPSGIIQGDALRAEAPTVFGCQVIASCNLMMRRQDFLALGGFDPFYFFFYEDMDLTWRAQAAGRRLAVLSPMPVIHHYSETRRVRNLWQHARNRMYFCLRNLPWRQVALLPLHDAGFILQAENLRRLVRRARQPAVAASAVVQQTTAARAGGRALLGRATELVLKMAAIVLLGYLAVPRVILPALLARYFGHRRGAAGHGPQVPAEVMGKPKLS